MHTTVSHSGYGGFRLKKEHQNLPFAFVWSDPATARGAVDEPWRECGVLASRWPSDGGVEKSCDELARGQGPLLSSLQPVDRVFQFRHSEEPGPCSLSNDYRQPYRLLRIADFLILVRPSLLAVHILVYELLGGPATRRLSTGQCGSAHESLFVCLPLHRHRYDRP